MWGEIDGMTKVPELAKFAWGARAIKEKEGFDLLGDRMSFRFFKNGVATDTQPPEQHKAYTAFEHWLSKKALTNAKKWAAYASSDSVNIFTCDSDDGYHYRATCNGSFGYVYMTAWADEEIEK